MPAEFGEDFAGVGDVDSDWSLVSGRLALAQAVAERVFEAPGGLFYKPTYGAGALNLIGKSGVSLSAGQLETQALLDERVEEAEAEVSFDEATEELRISLTIVDSQGPFAFVLDPENPLTIELLQGLE